VGVINLAHIKTIFAMFHKGKLQAIHKENGKALLGASENYVCTFLLLEWFIELQTLHNGNGNPFLMEVYKIYIYLNCSMKLICVQPNA
jgi:hypothetical protein